MSKYSNLVNIIVSSLGVYKRTYKQDANLVVISKQLYFDMFGEEGSPDGVHLPPYTPYHPSASLSQVLGVTIVLRSDQDVYHTYIFSCQEKDLRYFVGKTFHGVDKVDKLVGVTSPPILYSSGGWDKPAKPEIYKQTFNLLDIEAYRQYRERLDMFNNTYFLGL